MAKMATENIIEIWKTIENYPEYMISSNGRVKSLKYDKEKILKPITDKDGYLKINISAKHNRKTFFIHRLVAETFIPNPENKPYIDHINTIRTDNRVDNLEWCTLKENSNNPLTLEHKSKSILQFDKENNFIKQWKSIKEIENSLHICKGHISECCSGKRNFVNGYKWCFLRNYIDNFLADWLVDYQNEVTV